MIRSPRIDSDFFRLRNPPPPVAPQNVEWCCIWDSVQSVEQPCAGEDGVQFGAVRRRLREHLPRCGIIAADAVQALEKTGESTFLISHEFVWISRFRGGTSLNVLETRS